MLMQSNDLAVAYYLKEQFYDFMESKNRDEAYRKLRKFILSVQASELEEFNATLTMLSKCKDEITLLESKRSRSQSAIVQAILEQRDPDEEEVEFFNQYTAKIDEVRNNMYALQRELDNLEYR